MSAPRRPAPSMRNWFTPNIADEDFFVPPDFNLGQFFYTSETAGRLADALDAYRQPCCLCTPRLAAEWHKRGRIVRLLDYDERFKVLPGFRQFDLFKPEPSDEAFDVVIFDPIFVDAATLARAVRMVLLASRQADLYMTFPEDREEELTRAFSVFDLKRIDFPLSSCNIKPEYHGQFRLYGSRPIHCSPDAQSAKGLE